MSRPAVVRRATAADAADAARLLDAFNREYNDPTPGVEVLTGRLAAMIGDERIVVLLAGDGPDAVAQLAFRPSVWAERPDLYLAELYVRPELRGRGLGGALLDAAIELARERGAEIVDVVTSDDDTAAIGLYESRGLIDREGGPGGPRMRFYEREL